MARTEYRRNPSGISSMLFYIATIIIHDIFRTDSSNPNISLTSSYLDLSPLYGSNPDELDSMRAFEGGKIKPDTFSEKRLLCFAPGVGTILIMFNRFHNYAAQQLAYINENDRFSLPRGKEVDATTLRNLDEELFQTARLITCGLYINIILMDYLRTILNLNRVGANWNLDPRAHTEKSFGANSTSQHIGNQVSVEFKLVYRWYSCISRKDERWVEDFYQKVFPGQDIYNISTEALQAGLDQYEETIKDDPGFRDFHHIKRNFDGTLPDDELVQILVEGIEDCAGMEP
ncbi:hypothetical protein ABW19_dt0206713 [Dactylella cylindrospora]|nr:hypothetical protein ABW19_dt0206713 [Dactylella cylindrospora]